MQQSGLRVLVADGRLAMRAGLRALLRDPDSLVTTVEVADLAGALRVLRRQRVDVALVDARLVGIGTSGRREALRALVRRVPVVVMGMERSAAYAEASSRAGAAGYWPKDGDVGALACGLRAAAADDRRVLAAVPALRPPAPGRG